MPNPLFDMMNGNPMQIIGQMANTNPQQLLMNMLKQQNPKGYEQLQQMMNSGQDPRQILSQLTSNMTPQQMQQLKSYASQFGIK